jgi:hypothetical protein
MGGCNSCRNDPRWRDVQARTESEHELLIYSKISLAGPRVMAGLISSNVVCISLACHRNHTADIERHSVIEIIKTIVGS